MLPDSPIMGIRRGTRGARQRPAGFAMMAEDLQLRKVFDDVMAQVEEAKDLRYESVERCDRGGDENSSSEDSLTPPPFFSDVTSSLEDSLSFLFDKVLDKAVDIVQNSCVKRVVGERSGREIFQVKAGRSTGARRQSKGWLQQCHAADGQHAEVPDEYLVLPFHYCSCHAFQFEVINRGEAFLVSGDGLPNFARPTAPAVFRSFPSSQSADPALLNSHHRLLHRHPLATMIAVQAYPGRPTRAGPWDDHDLRGQGRAPRPGPAGLLSGGEGKARVVPCPCVEKIVIV